MRCHTVSHTHDAQPSFPLLCLFSFFIAYDREHEAVVLNCAGSPKLRMARHRIDNSSPSSAAPSPGPDLGSKYHYPSASPTPESTPPLIRRPRAERTPTSFEAVAQRNLAPPRLESLSSASMRFGGFKTLRKTTSLFDAIECGDIFKVNLFLRHLGDTPLSQLRHDHMSPLLYACKLGNVDAFEHLLKYGAQLDETDDDPRRCATAMHYAAWGGSTKMLLHLISKYQSPLAQRDAAGNTPMLYAIYGGHMDAMLFLQQQGASLHDRNSKGHSALLQAACGGHVGVVAWLVGLGFSVQDVDELGNTPLLFAAWAGHFSVVAYLLQHGMILMTGFHRFISTIFCRLQSC